RAARPALDPGRVQEAADQIGLVLVGHALDGDRLVHARRLLDAGRRGDGTGVRGAGAVGRAYVRSVRLTSLFAGVPFVGENSMLRMSLIDPTLDSAATPAGVGRRVSVAFPALPTDTRPLFTRALAAPPAARRSCTKFSLPGPDTTTASRQVPVAAS